MKTIDIVLMAAIISGAVLLLYRSLWKKRGQCPGCDARTCGVKVLKKGNGCR